MIVLGFQYMHEAMRFQDELRRRFAKFNLEAHTEKTSAKKLRYKKAELKITMRKRLH